MNLNEDSSSGATYRHGYSDVNHLKMYYEIHGHGSPLVLIHGGGSTIQSTFGRIIPRLTQHREIIAMELQAHGRTSDRDAWLSFGQDAEDIAFLLDNLQVKSADFLGFSNGGHTLIELALRHPERINKMIIASAFYKREGVHPGLWDGFDDITVDVMPGKLKEAFMAVNPNPISFQTMFEKDVQRMRAFSGWTDDQIRSIKTPALIINGNHDVGTIEHTVSMHRLIEGSTLVILPGGHGDYLGAAETLTEDGWKQQYSVDIVENFLNK